MRRSIYLLTILLLVLITSCKDNQEVINADTQAKITINLLNLNGGEKIIAGSSQLIKWYSNTPGNSIDIEYSTNGGNNWDTLAYNVPNTGSYLWTPVPLKISNYCMLKLSTRDNEKVTTYSTDVFSIIADTNQKVLSLLAPNNGSIVYAENSYKITWSSKGIAGIKITVSTDNGATWGLIASNAPADSGFYWWRPTLAMQSSQCKLKLADVSADTIVAISSGLFMITVPQSITLTQPAGGEVVYAGQAYDIKWTSSQVTSVKLEYTTNNGVTWNTIADNVPSNGFYSWNPVPNTISNNCKIRISDALDGYPAETSANLFSIQKAPTLKIVAPNGGEQFISGTSATIRWTSEGGTATSSISKKTVKAAALDDAEAPNAVESVKKSAPVSNVKIELTTNDGASWSVITASAVNNGAYVWDTIPAANSSLCKIKISDVNGGIPSAVSAGNFSINTQAVKTIKVLTPNGAESWQAGSTQNITWTSSGVTNVKIEYTTNNGVLWNTVAPVAASSGTYIWNSVPATASTNCKIKITDASDPNVSDISDAVFTISPEPAIVVLSPNGGEVFQSGSVKQITWSSVSIANVKIEYTINGGADWKLIIADTVSSGVYNWLVPNENTTQAKIRISKAGTGFPYGISAANFTINNQVVKQLSIISPNGGENWLAGTSQQIKWSGAGVTKVNVDYTADNGISWLNIASNISSTGALSWDPVPNVTSTQCLVRVSDAFDGKTTAVSNAPFSISPVKTIKIVKPVAGDVWTAGIPDTIKWTSTGLSSVRIEYTINNGLDSASWFNLTPSTASSGAYVTAFSVASTQYKIRISGVPDNSPSVVSNGTFTVLEQPSITVTAPQDGDILYAGTSANITWKSTNITSVNIEYTTNNGASWSVIENSVPSSGLYRWLVPSDPGLNSSQCKIRISNAQNNGIPQGTSAGTFSINQVVPGIKVTAPNGGEVWYSGSAQVVKWNSTAVSNVKIEYTTNNGVDWTTVAASVPSNGFYNWNPIPNTSSTNCKIKISDVDNKYTDMSDANFTISPEPSIAVLSPNGGEQLISGSSKSITWTSTNIAKVKLEYTTNNGANWFVITDSVESNGSYAWVVPNVNSSLCRVKVSEAHNGIPYAISANNFAITNQVVKQISLTKPTGGEIWEGGTRQTISWTSSNVDYVMLQYTTIAGSGTWYTIDSNVVNSGAYEWTIPDVNSTLCKIRVKDMAQGGPSDESKNVFTITPIPSIKVLYPNGWETIIGGTPTIIRWESVGLKNVKIESSTNNGLTWTSITESTPNNNSYVWTTTIPSNQYKIKISNIGTPSSPSDESDNTFIVTPEPFIQILSPNGGEQFVAGTSQNISWTSSNIDSVKIEYTTNNGSSWITIKDSLVNTGLFKWVIPDVTSSLCKIKISNSSNQNKPSNISASSFTINQVAPTITVTSPAGGESWDAGSAQVIKWNSAGITNVKIDYTTNNGVNWQTVAANVPSSGFYSWNPVPNTPSTNCKVRVSDVTNNYTGQSPQTFTIAPEPSIKIIEPNGGEQYQSGSVKQIKWTSVNVARVKIDYTINGGADWKQVVADTPSIGVFDWMVPNENSAQAKVRVSKAGSGIPFGISDNNFTISNKIVKQLSIIAPNGGESWMAGTSQQIKWSGTGVYNVKIEYSTDNGLSWNVLTASAASSGSYWWDPVPNINSTQCLVRISDVETGGPSAVSNGTFSVSPVKTITVIRPAAGETWIAGAPDTIKWASTGISNVKIEYTTNNGLQETDWRVLTASTASNGVYVTAFSVASTLYKVRITGLPEGAPTAMSNGTFTVLEQPSITVVSPSAGEQLLAGTSKDIQWTSTNIANVKIELTTNNGATWSPIVASTPSNGRFQWTVPTDPPVNSSLCQIQISNAINNGIPSAKSGAFTINQVAPSITVTSPKGGETWEAGSAKAITWTSWGVTNVKIELTTDNGVNWILVAGNLPSNGYYNWNPVPNNPSTNCKIKITDVDNKYTGISGAVFTITPEPAINVTSPVGGEIYRSGSIQQITWTSESVARVKLEYTVNGGADWKTICTDTVSNGFYNWVIPNENSNQAKVRISKAGTGIPFGISPANFTITNQAVPSITITSPNGGENWYGSSAQIIKWNSSGVTNVKIDYTTNNGVEWKNIIASTASTGYYNWNPVPNISSTNCRIRVGDLASSSFDQSDNVFTISPEPSIAVTSPNGGENLLAGSSKNITWTSTNIAKVKLEYTTNNGANWTTITDSVESTGNYAWTVPNVNSNLCRIKVSEARNGIPWAISENNFTINNQIVKEITLLSPVGGESWPAGTSQMILWKATGITKVNIDYTTNNGITWLPIIANQVSTGAYEWGPIPNINSTQCKVRVSDSAGVAKDESKNVFAIKPIPKVTLLKPNGGETWLGGSVNDIVWTSNGITSVKIESTTDNGFTWQTVINSTPSADTSRYQWSSSVPSQYYKIKVSNTENFGVPSDESDGTFTMLPEPSVKVTSPNGGENLIANQIHEIKWISSNIDSVKIEYTLDNGYKWITIVNSVKSNGLYNWHIDPSQIEDRSDLCKIRITEIGGLQHSDMSDGLFTINPKWLRVIYPNGGEYVLKTTKPPNILWSSAGISQVKIEYTSNNGVSWNVIENSYPSTGAYPWDYPNSLITSLGRIRITDVSPDAGPNPLSDLSDSFCNIGILPGTVSIRPNPNPIVIDKQTNIKWDASKEFKSFKVEYTDDAGKTWKVIKENVPNNITNSIDWNVPAELSGAEIKYRVTEISTGKRAESQALKITR
jgi:hypothetical protein